MSTRWEGLLAKQPARRRARAEYIDDIDVDVNPKLNKEKAIQIAKAAAKKDVDALGGPAREAAGEAPSSGGIYRRHRRRREPEAQQRESNSDRKGGSKERCRRAGRACSRSSRRGAELGRNISTTSTST